MHIQEHNYVTDWEDVKTEMTIRAKQFECVPRYKLRFHRLLHKFLGKPWEMTVREMEQLKWHLENTNLDELMRPAWQAWVPKKGIR